MARYVNYDRLLEERHRLGLDEMSNIIKVNALNHFIDKLPTADVVEVVRCKDCEHWHYTGKGLTNERIGICSNDDFPFHCEQRPITRETDFCSYGERKEGRSDE